MTLQYFVAAMLALAPPHPPPAPAGILQRGDSAELVRLEHQVEDAVLRRDMAFLERAYAPSFRFKHSEGLLQSRAVWLTAVRAGRFQTRRVDSLDVDVHGDVALVTGRLYVLPQSNDPGFRGVTVRYVRLYQRLGGQWRQLAHHSTKQTLGPPRVSK